MKSTNYVFGEWCRCGDCESEFDGKEVSYILEHGVSSPQCPNCHKISTITILCKKSEALSSWDINYG